MIQFLQKYPDQNTNLVKNCRSVKFILLNVNKIIETWVHKFTMMWNQNMGLCLSV